MAPEPVSSDSALGQRREIPSRDDFRAQVGGLGQGFFIAQIFFSITERHGRAGRRIQDMACRHLFPFAFMLVIVGVERGVVGLGFLGQLLVQRGGQ